VPSAVLTQSVSAAPTATATAPPRRPAPQEPPSPLVEFDGLVQLEHKPLMVLEGGSGKPTERARGAHVRPGGACSQVSASIPLLPEFCNDDRFAQTGHRLVNLDELVLDCGGRQVHVAVENLGVEPQFDSCVVSGCCRAAREWLCVGVPQAHRASRRSSLAVVKRRSINVVIA